MYMKSDNVMVNIISRHKVAQTAFGSICEVYEVPMSTHIQTWATMNNKSYETDKNDTANKERKYNHGHVVCDE